MCATARPPWRCTWWRGCCEASTTELTESQRLFVALELPAAVRKSLAEWQGSVACTGPREATLRAVGEDSLHVTLCFLGARLSSEVEAIAAACGAAATGRVVDGLAVGEPVWLPHRRPRVLAVAIEDDRGELRELQALLTAALVRGGFFEPESRLFLPHVTVARVRSGARVRRSALTPPRPVEFAAEAVALLRSHLGRGPAVYEQVHRVALAPG